MHWAQRQINCKSGIFYVRNLRRCIDSGNNHISMHTRYGSFVHSRLKQHKYSTTAILSTTAKEEECMLTLPPDNFSRYSKFLVRNSNGVDGMGGNNPVRKEREDLVWVDTLGEACYDRFNGQDDSSRPSPFSLLSWNILAQSLYEPHCDTMGIQPHPWPKRLHQTLQILQLADSDIICLQECELHSFQYDLATALSKLGYDGIAQEDERDSKPTTLKEITKHRDPRNHIVATFWKRDKFDVVGEAYVRTRSMTNVLRVKNSEVSPTVAVVNCHLEGNPKRFSERTHQLQHALTDLSKLMQKDSESDRAVLDHHLNALVIAGDFNCELQSSACSAYLQRGRLGKQSGLGGVHGEGSLVIPPVLLETNEATETLHPIVEWGRALPEEQVSDVTPHPFRRNGMTSAYPAWLGKNDAKEHFTYCSQMSKRPVPGLDQIWFSSMTMKRIALKRPVVDFLHERGHDSDLELKRFQERMKILSTGLPDPACKYPSDHLPIGCIFDWQCDPNNNQIRNLTVLDTEGNIIDFLEHSSETESLEFEEHKFDTPIDELEYLVLSCPYDSEDQKLAVEFILSPINPPLCIETRTKPTPSQLEQIKERREKKGEVLSSSSLSVRPWLKKIWKVNKQVGAWERNIERQKIHNGSD